MSGVHSKGRALAAAVVGAAALVLGLAAILDLGPFDDKGRAAVGPLPAAAPCEPSGPLPGAAAPRRDDGRLPIGFNDGAYLARQDTPEESAAMQRTVGSSVWRSVAQWQVMEPEPGRYDFSTTDPFYCAALAAGIAPLIHVTTSPQWAADPTLPCSPQRCTSPPLAEHYDELAGFAAALTARYPHAIAIEAWNEPNLHLFWASPDPERYVEVLRAIHDGVKAVDRSVPVLFGGLSDLAAEHPANGDVSLATFLDRALAAGAGNLVDAFNVHLYPQPSPNGDVPGTLRGLADARAILSDHGQNGRPIWITELGVAASGAVSRELQAESLLELYEQLDRAPDVVALLFHTLVEPNAMIVGGDGFGWVSQRDTAGAFRPYPVFCDFARLLAEPLDCTAAAIAAP